MKFLIVILVVMFFNLQYQLWAGEGSLPEGWKIADELANQKQENLALQKRNMSLAAEVEDLKKGFDAVEEYARDELGMIKENEVFYQILIKPLE